MIILNQIKEIETNNIHQISQILINKWLKIEEHLVKVALCLKEIILLKKSIISWEEKILNKMKLLLIAIDHQMLLSKIFSLEI